LLFKKIKLALQLKVKFRLPILIDEV